MPFEHALQTALKGLSALFGLIVFSVLRRSSLPFGFSGAFSTSNRPANRSTWFLALIPQRNTSEKILHLLQVPLSQRSED